ncbi:sodium channel subunit beta-3 isoform X2 [Lates calcarifer]|uniref:Sodium channel subunit beta-3 isoform X2 n=1 Tax=Lates calcarifer TaxID=8187 RepID=A0AAJ7V6F9_LATCA|nr:sodium channel subunit beta-3 isoform X2 [Lates calcarifer]
MTHSVSVSKPEQVKVTSGSNAVLRCQSPRGADIKTIEWTRPDLEVDGYIFFYENNRRQDKYQHPSFHGRVELENESAIKDGDVSVSLKNVTEQDAGTYVCLVSLKKTRRSRRDIPEQLSTITLTVQEPDRWPKVLQSGGVRNEFAGQDGRSVHPPVGVVFFVRNGQVVQIFLLCGVETAGLHNERLLTTECPSVVSVPSHQEHLSLNLSG